MKLSPLQLFGLFVLGAIVAPFGDHGHVITGTTEYLWKDTLFVWDSAGWFVLMVGTGTALLAEIRLHLGPARTEMNWRHGLAGIAAVMGIYALTALLKGQPLVPAVVLVSALGVLTWCALGDKAGAICGVIAAIGGVANEVATAHFGWFRYDESIGTLFGVAPWLPGLYFAFGVTTSVLAEILAKRIR